MDGGKSQAFPNDQFVNIFLSYTNVMCVEGGKGGSIWSGMTEVDLSYFLE